MTLWRWAALAAFGVICFSTGFGLVPGISACGNDNAIVALEFVTSPAEVALLFPQQCRAVHVAAQYQALALDSFGFIPVYSSFLILTLLAFGKESGAQAGRLVRAAIVMTLAAALSDQFENVQLYRLLGNLPGDQATINLLMSAVRIKFSLLALVVILIGTLLLRQSGWRKLVALALIGGSAFSLAGLFSNYAMVTQGSGIAWLILILTVFVSTIRELRAARN